MEKQDKIVQSIEEKKLEEVTGGQEVGRSITCEKCLYHYRSDGSGKCPKCGAKEV